jgi:hypothetical protein
MTAPASPTSSTTTRPKGDRCNFDGAAISHRIPAQPSPDTVQSRSARPHTSLRPRLANPYSIIGIPAQDGVSLGSRAREFYPSRAVTSCRLGRVSCWTRSRSCRPEGTTRNFNSYETSLQSIDFAGSMGPEYRVSTLLDSRHLCRLACDAGHTPTAGVWCSLGLFRGRLPVP